MRAWEFDDAGIVIQALLNHRPSTIDPQLWPSAPRADSAAWSPCAPTSPAPWRAANVSDRSLSLRSGQW